MLQAAETASAKKNPGEEERLDRLEALFKAHGFSALSVAEIVATLQWSRRALYELAPSKQDVIELIVRRRFQRIRQAGWDAVAQHQTVTSRLWAYLEVGVDALLDMGPKFLADIEADQGTSIIFDDHQKQRAIGIRQLVETGVAEGSFARYHPQLVADILTSSFRRMRDPAFLDATGLSLAEAWEELTRLIQNGLLPKTAQTSNEGGKVWSKRTP